MAIESTLFREKARRAYELARLRQALALSIPTLLVGAMVAAMIREVSMPLIFGVLLYLASVVLLWWGRSPARSVLPGIAYGLLPLTGGIIAKLHHHVCMGFSCYSTCMLYCVSGGLIAGLLVARLALKSQTPLAIFLSAAATALLTGAIGGSCVGGHGIIGMALGIGLGAIPLAFRTSLKR